MIACDAETTGLKFWKDEPFGLAFAWFAGGTKVDSIYVDIRIENQRRWAFDQLRRARKVVNHNIKFDAHFLREAGCPLDPAKIDCTMIREALIDEHRHEYSLDSLGGKYDAGKKSVEIWGALAQAHGGKATRDAQILNLQYAPEEMVATYACPDAAIALRVWLAQEREIEKQDLRYICGVERQLLGVVLDLEKRGVRVDLERAEIASKELDRQVQADQRELDRLVGSKVNVNSGPQVLKIVAPVKDDQGQWRARDGTPLEPTDGGNASVRTHALNNMKFPEAGLIANIRGMIKARDVFVNRYVLGDSYKGYIHCNINQTKTEADSGTTTGRMSVTEPALQQIHARDVKLARIVRSLFLPDVGNSWLSADYDQIDFRCFAHYVKEPVLLDAYAADPMVDFHGLVSKLVGVPRNRDQKTGGANAKQINLAMVFGMGQGKLAREMGLPYWVDERGYFRAGEAAEAIFKKYHATIPGIKGMTNGAESVAKARGYILTPLKRRLHFPRGQGAHKAAGLLFQGACADIIKYKMIEVAEMLHGTDSRLMLSVHDELCISLGKQVKQVDILDLLQRFDGEKTPLKFRVPILCKGKTGKNWFEATAK